MSNDPINELQGKNIAIVAMGQSQIDFHLSQTHSVEFDEVWAINAMIGVLPNIDRAFILDPMSRFLDTEDAGTMTAMMRKQLPYVIAYALWNKVNKISIFGVDYTYRSNMHFAEAGRGCVEFWLSKCIDAGVQIEIAPRSTLLDTDVGFEEKLYGYHRLNNPKVAYQNGPTMSVCKLSDIQIEEKQKPIGIIGRKDLNLSEPVEPKEY